MNEFYEDLLTPVMYRWLIHQDDIKSCGCKCGLYIEGDGVTGSIRFHNDQIIELEVKDKYTKEQVFYLHFQMHDMKNSIVQFNTFFQYLRNPDEHTGAVEFHQGNVKKILLSCSGGLTTSYFAYTMQEMLEEQHLAVQVDAVGYLEVEKVAEQYDVILLAPQISYMLPEFKNKFGSKVMGIQALDFATSNFDGILHSALD